MLGQREEEASRERRPASIVSLRTRLVAQEAVQATGAHWSRWIVGKASFLLISELRYIAKLPALIHGTPLWYTARH